MPTTRSTPKPIRGSSSSSKSSSRRRFPSSARRTAAARLPSDSPTTRISSAHRTFFRRALLSCHGESGSDCSPAAALALWTPAERPAAPRCAHRRARGGMLERDRFAEAQSRGSLADAAFAAELDSLFDAEFRGRFDLRPRVARTDDLRTLDSSYAHLASGGALAETGAEKTSAGLPAEPSYRKGWFMSDSMSLSKVCWLSTVLPGYGSAHNKNNTGKLPILYGTVGIGTGPIHPRKQHLPAAQTRLRRLHDQRASCARPSSTRCKAR